MNTNKFNLEEFCKLLSNPKLLVKRYSKLSLLQLRQPTKKN